MGEKYRPNTIRDCILPDELKKTFGLFVQDKHIPNMILSGGSGVGKTTVAKAMINEIGSTYMMINGSKNLVLIFYELRLKTLHLLFLLGVVSISLLMKQII